MRPRHPQSSTTFQLTVWLSLYHLFGCQVIGGLTASDSYRISHAGRLLRPLRKRESQPKSRNFRLKTIALRSEWYTTPVFIRDTLVRTRYLTTEYRRILRTRPACVLVERCPWLRGAYLHQGCVLQNEPNFRSIGKRGPSRVFCGKRTQLSS